MSAMYGKRPLNAAEGKGSFMLSNGMFCIWGNTEDEGLSVDVYKDKTKKELVSMQHGIVLVSPKTWDEGMLKMLMESMIDEF